MLLLYIANVNQRLMLTKYVFWIVLPTYSMMQSIIDIHAFIKLGFEDCVNQT